MKRKEFLVGCSAGLAMLAAPRLSLFASQGQENDEHCFVIVFLRGGVDGLQLVAPSSESFYQDVRLDGLKVHESGSNAGLLLQNGLNGIGFRLHPNAPELHEFYQDGRLAILHGCGLTNGTRSHFEAMALIERGLEQNGAVQKGWITRALHELAPTGDLPAIATSGGLPQSFAGYRPASSITNLDTFSLSKGYDYPDLLRSWYSGDSKLDETAHRTLDTLKLLSDKSLKTDVAAKYPDLWYTEEMNMHFRTLAQLIKEGLGVRIAMVDSIGWDTHENQISQFPRLVKGLSSSLGAFYRDLGNHRKNVTILLMSEFGRRLRSNRSFGTDHGYGNMMMVLGDRVKGGHMHGKWPGLSQDALDRGVDLDITTDYRAVLGEILQETLQLRNIDRIFPGYSAEKPIGLFFSSTETARSFVEILPQKDNAPQVQGIDLFIVQSIYFASGAAFRGLLFGIVVPEKCFRHLGQSFSQFFGCIFLWFPIEFSMLKEDLNVSVFGILHKVLKYFYYVHVDHPGFGTIDLDDGAFRYLLEGGQDLALVQE